MYRNIHYIEHKNTYIHTYTCTDIGIVCLTNVCMYMHSVRLSRSYSSVKRRRRPSPSIPKRPRTETINHIQAALRSLTNYGVTVTDAVATDKCKRPPVRSATTPVRSSEKWKKGRPVDSFLYTAVECSAILQLHPNRPRDIYWVTLDGFNTNGK